MNELEWIIVAVASYLIGFFSLARYVYAEERPYREPVNCAFDHREQHIHTHSERCYDRAMKTEKEAVNSAVVWGLFWPLFLGGCAVAAPIYGLGVAGKFLITKGIRELPAEKKCRDELAKKLREEHILSLEREVGIK